MASSFSFWSAKWRTIRSIKSAQKSRAVEKLSNVLDVASNEPYKRNSMRSFSGDCCGFLFGLLGDDNAQIVAIFGAIVI